MKKYFRCILAAAALMAAAACSSDHPIVDPLVPILTVDGRLERGSTVQLIAVRGRDTLAIDTSSIVITPSTAGTRTSGNSIRLLTDGDIIIAARAAGTTITRQISVAAPPTIWFDMWVNGNRDIYSVSLDGEDLRRITTSTAEDRDATVSSSRLVFVSDRAGAVALYGGGLDGSGVLRLTNSTAAEGAPSLSPDGTRLAFVRTTAALPRLFFAASDGSGASIAPTGITFSGGVEGDPTLCTSDRVVFMSTEQGNADLMLLASQGNVTPLVASERPEVEPACSADGTHVAFVSTVASGTGPADEHSHIFVVDVATRNVTQITTGDFDDGQPAYLADGRIVFTRFHQDSSELLWVDPDEPAVLHSVPVPTGRIAGPAALRR